MTEQEFVGTKIQEVASSILDKSNELQVVEPVELPKTEEREVGFAILTVLTVISIVIELVKLYKSCKQSPTQVADSFQTGGLFNRAALRRAIRKSLKEQGIHKNLQDNLETSVKEVGFKLSVADIEKLYQEVG